MEERKIRAIIADDEPMIISLIKKLGNWDELGIEIAATANDGITTLNLIETVHPDIVIVDIRMPGMEGIEVIGECRNKGITAEFIIVSGYQEFSYAQQGITYGVLDYLVKPINRDALNRTLAKACREIRLRESQSQETSRMKNLVQKQDAALLEQLFFTMEENVELQGDYFASLVERFRMQRNYGGFCVLLAKIDIAPSNRGDYLETCMSYTKEAIHEAAAKIVPSADISCAQTVCRCILNYPRERNKELIATLEGTIRNVRQQLKNYGGCVVTFGLSQYSAQVTDLPELYIQAKQASAYRHVFNNAGKVIVYNKEIGDLIVQTYGEDLTIEQKENLYSIFDRQDVEGLRNLCREIGKAENGSAAANYCRYLRFRKLNELFFQIASEYDFCCEDIAEDKERSLMILQDIAVIDIICNSLQEHMEKVFLKIVESKAFWNDRHIRAAKRYIETHYQEQIQLEDVAAAININANYFSALFKKKTGLKFSQYLQQVRMDAAKKLLSQPQYSVKEVCALVGYNDIKYFSNLFRSIVGVTPSLYQKMHARLDV